MSHRDVAAGDYPDLHIKPMTLAEKSMVDQMEDTFHFEMLFDLRQRGCVDILRESRKAKDEAAARSWSSWLGRTSAPGVDDDVRIEDLLPASASVKVPSTLRVELRTRWKLQLWGSEDLEPLLTSTSSAWLGLSLNTSDQTWSSQVCFADLKVQDHTTPTPVTPFLITTQRGDWPAIPSSWGPDWDAICLDDSMDILCSLHNRAGLSVKVLSRSFVFSFNKPLIASIEAMFSPPVETRPEVSRRAAKAAAGIKRYMENPGEEVLATSIHADFVSGGPKLLLHLDCSVDRGTLVLDLGVLSVRGGQTPEAPLSSSWALALTDINARFARQAQLLSAPIDPLLAPFDVSLDFRSCGNSRVPGLASISVDVILQKAVIGSITSVQLENLLFIANHVTDAAVPTEVDDPKPAAFDVPEEDIDIEETNPAHVLMAVSVRIKQMSLNLLSEPLGTGALSLDINDVKLDTSKRHFDSTTDLTVSRVKLLDSSRPEACDVTVLEATSSPGGPALRYCGVSVESTASPSCKRGAVVPYQSTVLSFGNVRAALSAPSFARLKPFYRVLTADSSEACRDAKVESVATAPGVQTVSVDVMFILLDILDEESCVPVTRASITFLSCEMETKKEAMTTKVCVASVSLSDARPQCKHWKYRHIVEPAGQVNCPQPQTCL